LGVGVAIFLMGFPNVNILTTITLPLLILTFSTLLYKVARTIRRKSLKLIGQNAFNLAVIVLLLGVFISAGAKTTTTLTSVKTNTPVEAPPLRFELSNLTITNSSATIYNEQAAAIIPEYSALTANVTIKQFGKTYHGSLSASFYPNYGLHLRPLIMTTEIGDVYVHLEYTDSLYDSLVQTLGGNSSVPETVSVTVQTNPMVYLVWGGVALMLVGISVQFIAEIKQKPENIAVRK
jgi:cytochrome c biogenesis factor